MPLKQCWQTGRCDLRAGPICTLTILHRWSRLVRDGCLTAPVLGWPPPLDHSCRIQEESSFCSRFWREVWVKLVAMGEGLSLLRHMKDDGVLVNLRFDLQPFISCLHWNSRPVFHTRSFSSSLLLKGWRRCSPSNHKTWWWLQASQ